jgi:transcriptional regulator of acetoin/glycerol metabolism
MAGWGSVINSRARGGKLAVAQVWLRSNQAHSTTPGSARPPEAITVIAGPPDFRRTTSPTWRVIAAC